jgi:glycerol kinase
LAFGTVDSYLLWRLRVAQSTPPIRQYRVLLFNIHSGDWDDELLRLFDVRGHCCRKCATRR